MLLNKVVKEKDELRDSNSQLECRINDLRACVCGWKERLLTRSGKIETAEMETWDLILPLAELQHKRNAQPRWAPATKVKAQTGGNGIMQVGTGTCGETLMQPVTVSPSILGTPLVSNSSLFDPTGSILPVSESFDQK